MPTRALLLLFAAAAAYAQPGGTTPPGTTRSGPSLPATCSPGPLAVYFKTTATVGLYQCLTANTWTAVPTGSGPTGAAGGKLSGTYPNPGLNAASTDLTDTANLPRLDANNVFTGTQTIGATLLDGNAIGVLIANAGTTGTTRNKLAKLTGAPSTAVLAATTDANGILGIVVSGAGTTGSAAIARFGLASCVFDGATVANDYVQISSSVAGDCHDVGATYPTSGQVLGFVLSTHGSGGTYQILIHPDIVAAGLTSSNVIGLWSGTCNSTSLLGGDGICKVVSSAFSALATGSNTTAAMTVGSGASLTYAGSGTVNASSLGGAVTWVPGASGTGLTIPAYVGSGTHVYGMTVNAPSGGSTTNFPMQVLGGYLYMDTGITFTNANGGAGKAITESSNVLNISDFSDVILKVYDGGNYNPYVTLHGNGSAATLTFGVAPIISTLSGSGNAYACLDSTGKLYRSGTACI